MPQMDPLPWVTLFMYFMIIFYSYLSMTYFMYMILPKKKEKENNPSNHKYWKTCL